MGESEPVVPADAAETSETIADPARDGVPGLLSRTFQAFRYRDFRLMWVGAFTSATGTWMQQVAESWVVLGLTNSPFYLGLTAFLGQLPFIFFTLIGGVAADRVDRRKLLLGSQCIQMFTAFTLTTLLISDSIQIWHLLLAVFAVGTAQAFGGPAYMALIPGLVKREGLPNAIALNSIQFNLARVIGPLLAGAALALVGPALCFGLNSLSFVAVMVSLYMIRVSFNPEGTEDSILSRMRKGFAFLRGRGSLWQLSVLGFISTFCGVPLITLLPVFAKDVFDIGSMGYSTMMATSGVGSVIGALLYASLTNIANRGKLALWIQPVFALLIVIFAFSRSLVLSHCVLFLGGACLVGLFASITSLVQLNTTEEMRGRVMSIFMLAFRGGMPLGSLTAGSIASQVSASFALFTVSVLLALGAIGFLASNSRVKAL